MKKFKIIDLWVNIVLIAGFTIASLVNLDNTFLAGYFIVGAWQLTGILVHVINRCFTIRGGNRYYYHCTALGILMLLAVGSVIPSILIVILFLLLFAAPLMAVYYTWLCYNEVFVKMQRPLAVLK